ncbi:MAG: hypothetical protein K2W95_16245 [Candidatus Obscuribacterales bacterium]|nr:hypothetical protein [Candidatus Obscuribacterales bacterium]
MSRMTTRRRRRRRRRKPSSNKSSRVDGGYQLIELLIAVGILSTLMASIMDGLSQVHRQTTASQNQVIATNIAQEIVDQARNADWTTLNANMGTRTLLVNKQNSADSGTGYNTRPLMLDMVGQSYTPEASANLFRGTVQQTLTNVGAGRMRLTVNVSWPGEHGGGNKSLIVSTMISQYGIHN